VGVDGGTAGGGWTEELRVAAPQGPAPQPAVNQSPPPQSISPTLPRSSSVQPSPAVALPAVLVPKQAGAGKDHGDAVFVGGGDDFGVAD